jgi:hypothetical protein
VWARYYFVPILCSGFIVLGVEAIWTCTHLELGIPMKEMIEPSKSINRTFAPETIRTNQTFGSDYLGLKRSWVRN